MSKTGRVVPFNLDLDQAKLVLEALKRSRAEIDSRKPDAQNPGTGSEEKRMFERLRHGALITRLQNAIKAW